MIKVNELRLGNFILLHGKPIAVEAISISNPQYHDLHSADPIKLTRKWIERFGLVEDETTARLQWMKKYSIRYFDLDADNEIINGTGKAFNLHEDGVNEFYFKDWKARAKIKYVHQLQNLFFALAQQELLLI